MTAKATNFRFDEQTSDLLEQLKVDSGSASKSEVVRKALALLKIATDAKKHNERLVIQANDDHGKEREILLW